MKPRLLLLGAVLGVSLTGCAHLTIQSITNDAMDTEANGFRFYESSPYLLVYSDGKGGIVSKVVYIPDQTKKRSAIPKRVLASLNTSLTFKDGVLTLATGEADATAIPKQIIKALATLAPLAAQDVKKEHEVPAPQLFKIVAKGEMIKFIGGPGDQNVKVTIVPEVKK